MDIEFDNAKDAANILKHGVSLAFGEAILENPVGVAEDNRKDYKEKRVNAYGFVNYRLYACTYTIRNGVYRIISVRKASRQEQRAWQS